MKNYHPSVSHILSPGHVHCVIQMDCHTKAIKVKAQTSLKQGINEYVIVSSFPGCWTPQTTVLEGMFMTQTPPVPGIHTFRNNTWMLLKWFVQPPFNAGTNAIHVLFDDLMTQNIHKDHRK